MKLFSPEFYAWMRQGSLRSAREIVPLICQLIKPDRGVDIACGTGEWLKVFREHGAQTVLGVEADWIDPDTLCIEKDEFLVRDIAEPLDIDDEFDLVLMLEAIQHVPAHRAREMVQTLTRLAPYVLLSAPVPYQGGSGDDVHEQWPEFWAALFEEREFVCIDALRRQIWTNERVDWWYAQNLLLFVKKEELMRNKALRLALAANLGPPPPLVHPKLYTARSVVAEPQR